MVEANIWISARLLGNIDVCTICIIVYGYIHVWMCDHRSRELLIQNILDWILYSNMICDCDIDGTFFLVKILGVNSVSRAKKYLLTIHGINWLYFFVIITRNRVWALFKTNVHIERAKWRDSIYA